MKIKSNEEIVISGISGRYPESDSIDEFSHNLYNKVDMITDDERRFPKVFNGCPMSSGKLKNVHKFDANFFGVSDWEADYMDSQIRAMLETTYEAIWDSGLTPESLSGTNTGVFVGQYMDEELVAYRDYTLLAAYKNFMSQTIAHKFNLLGPTFSADSACASSLVALHEAFLALRNGRCDQAIVIGVNISFNPGIQYNFFKLNMISPDSKCMCLDESANGYAKGEACVSVVVQLKSSAKRIYASIVNIKSNNDGYKEEGITFPSWQRQSTVISATYAECGVDPTHVDYVEAHCTGTKAGDPVEMRAIYDSMIKGLRDKPLMIGALKSNIGHTEGASGLCALTKVILSFENQCIPANIHFNKPNPNIESLINGYIKPINEKTPFFGDLIAVNNFGFGGSNTHLILRSPQIKAQADNDSVVDTYPRLVQICGRNEESVQYFFDKLFDRPEKITKDLLHLINEMSKITPFKTTTGCRPMRYRGFVLITQKTQTLLKYSKTEIKKVSKNAKQLCFIYTGIGSQWISMAKQLMNFDVIKQSLERSYLILRDKGINLMNLLIENNSDLNKSALNSMVSLVAIQIALTDLLKHLDVIPDRIIGYSIGEIACAYADGCIGAEEAILIAYYCGKFIDKVVETKGLNPKISELKRENLSKFLDEYYEEVLNSLDTDSKIETLLDQLNTTLNLKQLKTNKWITNTNTRSSTESQYICGQYFVDSLLFPVLFRNTLASVPNSSIIVEVSPDSLMETEIKDFDLNYTYFPLMRRNSNNLKIFLKTIGKLYTKGINTKIERLYAPVSEPVSTGTRILSPFLKWDHSKSYKLTKFPEFFNFLNCKDDESYNIDLMDPKDLYIKDHCIDGKILVPATAYLLFAWKSLAFHKKISYKDIAVEFRDVQIFRATPIQTTGKVRLYTNFDVSTGRFDIIDSGTVVVSGYVFEIKGNELQFKPIFNEIKSLEEDIHKNDQKCEPIVMKSKDVYKVLRIRGYNYGKQFQCISQSHEIDDKYVSAKITWNDNFVTFSDCVLQTYILGKKSKHLLVPVVIDLFRCDPKILFQKSPNVENSKEFDVIFDPELNIAVTNGLEIRGVKASPLQRNVNSQKPALRSYDFSPFDGYFKYENEESFLIYRRICDKLALKVINNEKSYSSKGIDSQLLNRIPEEFKVLYKILLDLCEDITESNNKISDLDKDLMSNTTIDKNFLRSQMTVVLENRNEINNNDLNIVELNESSSLMYSTVMNGLDIFQYSLRINYSLIHLQSITTELENNSEINKYIFNNSCIGPEVDEIDLIVYKDQSLCYFPKESNSELNSLFISFWQKLKSKAFVIILLKDELNFAEKYICDKFKLKTYEKSRKDLIITEAQRHGFALISDKSDCFSVHSLLFRKLNIEFNVNKQIFIRFTNEYKEWFEELIQEFKGIDAKPEDQNIWLLSNGANEGLLGFMKCLKKEPNGHRVRCLQIMDTNIGNNVFNELNDKNEELNEIVRKDLAINIVKDQKAGHFVLNELSVQLNTVWTKHCFLNLRIRGDLSSFQWYECQHKYWPIGQKDNQRLVHIYFSALNFKDVMLATGRLQSTSPSGDTQCLIGFEFTGRDENMNRVMGMISSKALATTCVVEDTDFLWPIPEHWTLEESATVPCVYATAYYALIIRGKLKPNEKVLIHSGSGGVGQAAIRICLSMNCQLFITVGSDSKREYLKKLFPVLKNRNFSSSRDLSFKTQIIKQTNGLGVDLILNSLSDEKLFASLECLATNGRFLEIGKYDFERNTILNISELLRNKTFHGIQVDTLFVVNDKTSKKMLRDRQRIWDLISDGIEKGVVVPLDRTVYDHNNCEEAFRFMASGRHVGKVVIRIRDEELDNKYIFRPIKLSAIPRTVFYPNKSYVITGGLGGMGLEIIDWMVERGAKKFIITSRTGPKHPYQYSRLKYFSEIGVEIKVWKQDIISIEGTTGLLKEALELDPIGGIFHLSLVLSDGLLENQTIDSFDKVFGPKSKPLVNLDSVSRELCPQLDYFVVFSSAVSCHGNAGQTNYGFTNSVMERLCEQRRREGLSALVVQWGLVGDVGYVADNITTDDYVLGATRSQRLYSCLQTLDKLLQMDFTIVSSVVFNDMNRKTECFGDRKNLLKKVSHILGHKDFHKFDAKTRLSELGMDSLMSVEIKQTIERDFDLVLSTQEIQNMTIERIRQLETTIGKSVKTLELKDQKDCTHNEDNEEIFQIPEQSMTYLNGLRNGQKVFYLPPTDGTHHLFRSVAELMDRPVIGLNWTEDCLELGSVRETALHFLNVIFNTFPDSGLDFDLISYSYGVFVAIEMTAILQKEYNKCPKLVALDMCPIQARHDLQFSAESTKDIFNGDEELNLIFSFIMNKISIESKELSKLLTNVCKTERIEKVSKVFVEKSEVKYGLNEVMFAIRSHVQKVQQMIDYSSKAMNKIKGNVLLLRSNQHLVRSESTKAHIIYTDYGFKEMIDGECKVHVFDGNHIDFLANNSDKIAFNINSYLNTV